MGNETNEILKAECQQSNEQEKTPEVLLPERYQPKPLFELQKDDTVFALCALAASVFTAIFGIFGGFAFGYLLSIVLMTALFCIYFAKGGKVHVLPFIYGILSLANGTVFICISNGSVRFFAVLVSFLLSLVCFDGMTNDVSHGNRQTIGIFYSAASTIGNIGTSIKSLFASSDGDKKAIGKVLIGLVCAIPVLIIVIPLLISSDDAFRGMMSNISGNTFSTILKAIFGIILSLFAISYGFSLKTGRITKVKEGKFTGVENVYIISFLSAIAVCYLLYLFSQLAYFFSAFKGFLPDGDITYAQYARKGFFEMCIIAVINLGLVFFSMLLAKKQNGKVCAGLQIIATFISVFTLIIIATAISKMVLYISEYGMTILRITTSAFMLFLAVVFISVILRIYITKINIVKTALLSAGLIVMLLGTVNVNAICAKYNYEAYKLGKLDSVDIEAIYNLGDEGIPYITRLAYSEDEMIADEAKQYLSYAYCDNVYFDNIKCTDNFTVDDLKQNKKQKGFKQFSIPKDKAYDALYTFLEKNPDFSSQCDKYFSVSYYDYNW